jgi:SAM-dependent methyltransferase
VLRKANALKPDMENAALGSVRDLIDASRGVPLLRALDAALPYNADILDVGCETGEVTNYLSVSARNVTGIDANAANVAAAEEFRASRGLDRARFICVDPLHAPFQPNAFDAVVCLRWLRGIPDQRNALQHLVALVKPNGWIVLGLDHGVGASTRALNLLAEAGLAFVRAVPAFRIADDDEIVNLFEPQSAGSALDRAVADIAHLGVWSSRAYPLVVIGRKS